MSRLGAGVNKYFKVGYILTFFFLALKIEATNPDTVTMQAPVADIHKVSASSSGTTRDLSTAVYGTGTLIGTIIINNNNPYGFAIRLHSKNVAEGYKNALGQSLLKLDSSLSGITPENAQSGSAPGFFCEYQVAMPMSDVSGTLGATIDASSGLFLDADPHPIKNVELGVNADQRRFINPTEATVASVFNVYLHTTSNTTLFYGTFSDVIEVAILDFDSLGDDGATLYDADGNSASWSY